MLILTVTLLLTLISKGFTIMETVMIAELYRHGTRYSYNNIFGLKDYH